MMSEDSELIFNLFSHARARVSPSCQKGRFPRQSSLSVIHQLVSKSHILAFCEDSDDLEVSDRSERACAGRAPRWPVSCAALSEMNADVEKMMRLDPGSAKASQRSAE